MDEREVAMKHSYLGVVVGALNFFFHSCNWVVPVAFTEQLFMNVMGRIFSAAANKAILRTTSCFCITFVY